MTDGPFPSARVRLHPCAARTWAMITQAAGKGKGPQPVPRAAAVHAGFATRPAPPRNGSPRGGVRHDEQAAHRQRKHRPPDARQGTVEIIELADPIVRMPNADPRHHSEDVHLTLYRPMRGPDIREHYHLSE